MTRTQRKMHLVLWLVLGPAALTGLVLAVLARPPIPVQPGQAPGTEPTPSSPSIANHQRPGAPDE